MRRQLTLLARAFGRAGVEPLEAGARDPDSSAAASAYRVELAALHHLAHGSFGAAEVRGYLWDG
jgi:hypothetical protein